MKDETEKVEYLSEFIRYVEDKYHMYPNGRGMNNPTLKTFAFRGCSDESYELIPSLFRQNIQVLDDNTIHNDLYLSTTTERNLLKTFIKYAGNYINLDADDYAHWAEYAQHYGTPTRFLDWSNNPLVSLYFACQDEHKDGCVWLLHKPNYIRYTDKFGEITNEKETIGESIKAMMSGENDKIHKMPILYQPIYVDDRMKAQDGLFMSWGYEKEPLNKQIPNNLVYVQRIDELGISKQKLVNDNDGILFNVRIPKAFKKQLLRSLDVVNINEMTLFPGLDGIGKYVEKKYRFDYQEAIDNFF